jgi:CRP-like cAMP-binding protein
VLILEKVVVLKSVELFAATPESDLVEVAHIAKEMEFRRGEEVIREGEPGDAMFIVVNGSVRIHREGKDLAVVGPRQVFGEMAALDPEPRAASATALEDTLLLSISGQHLYDLMAEHLEVAKGVIRVLCQRVRATNR